MRYSFIFLSFFLISLSGTVQGQDVVCNVEINAERITNTERTLFEDMKESISEFVNNRKWTTDKFKPQERVEFSLLINLSEAQGESFSGSIQIQSRRPVYMSGYNSTIINHKDSEVSFNFSKFDVLQFSDQAATQNELTAIIAYYTYLVLGMDYDTFSKKGGAPYLNKALNILNQFSSTNSPGWKAFENQTNRHWIITNYLDSRFEPLRECMYLYHRKGLDVMHNDAKKGRKAILAALQPLEKVYRNMPNNINMRMFFNAKSTEIVNIFSEAEGEEKSEVVKLLQAISPGNNQKWNKIQ